MYKPVKADDIFSAADGNRAAPVPTPKVTGEPAIIADPEKGYNQMSDAEAIRSMGDRLSKIWED